MIELPEARHLAGQFRDILQGKTVMRVTANSSPHKFAWFHGDPGSYHDRLAGKTVTGSNAYGGMPEIVFGGLRLVFCDGTNVRFFERGEKLPEKHQLHVEFDDLSSLVCSVQMYGAMWLLDDDGEGYYLSSKSKISPLSEENTGEYFFGLMDGVKGNYSIKAFLATEQRFPGLGNGVLQDILFNAKISPRRKLAEMTLSDRQAVYRSVKETLTEMTAAGGRDTEKDLLGRPGGYRTLLSAKTKDCPCPRCGGVIIKEAFLGGSIYRCTVCQPVGE